MIINHLYFLFLKNINLHLQSIHKERFLPSLTDLITPIGFASTVPPFIDPIF